jgi:hypothetical protein
MLAAIDAYFSASDGTEEEVAENLLLDVRDEINKQKYVPETNFGNMAEPKIGCVNHDCDQCRAVQEPVARYCCHSCFKASGGVMLDRMILCSECGNKRCPKASDHNFSCTGSNEPGQWGSIYTTPPAPQPVPVKTYHDGKPWPVAPKPWVGLTHEEVNSWELPDRPTVFEFAKFIEAKLKEKNT